MKFQVILLILPYTVYGFGVSQPGLCEETNKKVKPLSNVTLSTILGQHWDLAEYSDRPLTQVCAHYKFTKVNATVVHAIKKYRNKRRGKELSTSIYIKSTGRRRGRFNIVRQDATGLPLDDYFGFVIYDDGDVSVWYACRDLGENIHKDEGFVLRKQHKQIYGTEFEAVKAAYQRNGLNPDYVQKMKQCT